MNISVSDGCKASFCEASWLDGQESKSLASHVFDISKKKKWSVKQVLSLNALIDQTDLAQLQSANHITEFVNL
jgi:hypothetical protein